MVNSSTTYLFFPSVVDPFVLTNSGILLNAELLLRLKYFTAYQIFILSARKLF